MTPRIGKRAWLSGLGVVLFLALAFQFIPYGRDHTNPPVLAEPPWDSPRTRELFFRACADCHSNETVWPWYGKIAPASWFIYHHVKKGRKDLNVSEWKKGGKNEGDEAAVAVEQGSMPPGIYALAHPAAKLTPQEQQEFIRGLQATFGGGEKKEKPRKKPGIKKRLRWFFRI